MKVLFLPVNVASIQAISVKAINHHTGSEARYISITESKFHEHNKYGISLYKRFTKIVLLDKLLRFVWRRLFYRSEIKKWIRWADVLHYSWMPAIKGGVDLAYAAKLGKPIFVEWVGSEIRDPEILSTINPYYKAVFTKGYEYQQVESKSNSVAMQNLFAKYGAIPLAWPEIMLFINKTKFKTVLPVMQRVEVRSFQPQYPLINNKRPLIVHTPSALVAKGTSHIIAAIEALKDKYEFDFKIVHDMSHADTIRQIESCDIFIDQLIIGSYGIASLEALSLGKPVICYLMDELYHNGLPADCPIVNANVNTLKEQLIRLLNDAELRNEIGRKSRSYAEKYHDAEKIAIHLLDVYKQYGYLN